MRHFGIDEETQKAQAAAPADKAWIATIKLGETVTVESTNSSVYDLTEGHRWGGPRFDKETPKRLKGALNRGPWRFVVEGVREGEWIAIHVEDIQVFPFGYIRRVGPFIRLDGAGVLEVRDGQVIFPGNVSVPARPMLGCIGVVRKEDYGNDGPNGGNLDNPDLVAGTILHVKAQRDGGPVELCDCHAVQGDGEIPGAGVEIEATTRFRVERSEGFNCRGAVLETPDEWQTYGVRPLWEDAIRYAFYEMVELLRGRFGLSYEDANVVVGTCAHPRACGLYAVGGLNLNNGGLSGQAIMRMCMTKDVVRV